MSRGRGHDPRCHHQSSEFWSLPIPPARGYPSRPSEASQSQVSDQEHHAHQTCHRGSGARHGGHITRSVGGCVIDIRQKRDVVSVQGHEDGQAGNAERVDTYSFHRQERDCRQH